MQKDRLLLVAFLLSGVAALGYELLWTRLLAIALGSESQAVLGVLAGFFGGMALGSWLLHERLRYTRNPALIFCLLECFVAGYALLSPHLLYWLAYNLPPVLGPVAGDNSSFLALVLTTLVAGIVLLPGTICMGATIAALVEARRRVMRTDPSGRGIARLYGANTLGATFGVALCVYILMPRLGLVGASVLLSVVGLCSAFVAYLWQRSQSRLTADSYRKISGSDKLILRRAYLILGMSGLAGLGLEVVGVQVLAQVFQDTVFTFANILAVYLLGTSAGAWCYSRASRYLTGRSWENVTATLLLALTLSVPFTAWTLSASPGIMANLIAGVPAPFSGAASEALIAGITFALPTLLMGALFSHVTGILESQGVGKAYAINTVGGALAPFVFGLLAIPQLGYANTLYLAAAVYFLLMIFVLRDTRWNIGWRGAAVLIPLLAVQVAPGALNLVAAPAGSRLVSQVPGIMGLVTVSEDQRNPAFIDRTLQVNGHFRMGGNLSFGERRMGHIPMLLAPEAKSALFLGIGTGATLGSASHYSLERIDAVELVPEVLDVFEHFHHINEAVDQDDRFKLHAADARRFVSASQSQYDVIVADLFHPARDGAGSLYSLEHFRTVRDRLAPGGIFAQWIPLYQLDERNLQTILNTFLAVFPEVHSFLGMYNAETPPFAIGRIRSKRNGTDH